MVVREKDPGGAAACYLSIYRVAVLQSLSNSWKQVAGDDSLLLGQAIKIVFAENLRKKATTAKAPFRHGRIGAWESDDSRPTVAHRRSRVTNAAARRLLPPGFRYELGTGGSS